MPGKRRAKKRRFESESAFDNRMLVKRPATYRKSRQGNIAYAKRTAYTFLTGNCPLPKQMPARFIYHNILSTTAPVLGAASIRVWAANGLYDPDITSTGHQPRGFDQLMALYDHYVGISAKITVTFLLGESITEVPILVGVSTQDGTATLSSVNDYIENANCQFDTLSKERDQLTMTASVNVPKFLGRSDALSDPDLKGNTSSNPAEGVYFHIFMRNLSGANEAQDIIQNVLIEYFCYLIEPKSVAQS